MHEVNQCTEVISSLSVLVGTARCNANCRECAGRQHRKDAPQNDGEIDAPRLKEALDHCYQHGCRYVSLTGSGEPTLSPGSVTKALEIIHSFAVAGKAFQQVNLYTNGLRIGNDPEFCTTYLPLWRRLGLTAVYVSAYSSDEVKNARAFGVRRCPSFKDMFASIKKCGFRLRVSVILKKGYADSAETFRLLCEKFFQFGCDDVTAWPLRNELDDISELAPEPCVLEAIYRYSKEGNGRIRTLHCSNEPAVKNGIKVALFQDGELSDNWCTKK